MVILLLIALAAAGAVAVGYAMLRSVSEVDLTPPRPATGCVVAIPDDSPLPASEGDNLLDPDQAANAATVSGVAFGRDLPDHAVVVAFATVWQESQFYNLSFGDADSLGLFQQRPSMDWGSPDELMDPVYASNAFYEVLEEVSEYQELPVHEAAQEVQRSIDGSYYDQHELLSRDMAHAFTGQDGAAVYCWDDAGTEAEEWGESGTPDDAATELERVFGVAPADLAAAPERQTGDLGWAMAQWTMAHAPAYGVTSVEYDGHRWSAVEGHEGWVEVTADAEGADGADTADDGALVIE